MTDVSTFSTLEVHRDHGVMVVTLNRPEALNAITPLMCTELVELIQEVHGDDSVRVVVITGRGRAFCAGGDVAEDVVPVSKMTPWEYRRNVELYAAPMLGLVELDRPVIAAVNGVAVGGGWDLALACDIRIASSKARFKDAYVQLAVLPELGGTYFLPRLAGLGRAKLLSFTGDMISADEALRYGLVEEVVDASMFDDYVMTLARRIAAGPAKAIAMTKLAMNRSLNFDLRGSMDYAKSLTPSLISSPDYREAIAAFIEKRPANFEGA
ncbi:2-(1,2-epoxy-1,2-dihydrophenyl)acetyl-CoA isomerase PaaG [soil metagenome]